MQCTGDFKVTLCAALLASSSFLLAQTSVVPPSKLAGHYSFTKGKKAEVFEVELTGINVDGDKVSGVLSKFRNPSGNCISENTPFKGTYKDGELNVKSDALKSQRADEEGCGRGVAIVAKLVGDRWNGTLTTGRGEPWALDLAAK